MSKNAKIQIKTGEVGKLMLENSVAYNTDCQDGLKTISNDVIDLTVTSPPYDGIRTYKGFSLLRESKRLSILWQTAKTCGEEQECMGHSVRRMGLSKRGQALGKRLSAKNME